MKKTILFLLLVLLSSGAAHAEELVITLKSGDTIVVQYTGVIQGVTMKGTTDAIAGISMPQAATPSQTANQQGSGKNQAAVSPDDKGAGKAKDAEGIRFKWAEPIGED